MIFKKIFFLTNVGSDLKIQEFFITLSLVSNRAISKKWGDQLGTKHETGGESTFFSSMKSSLVRLNATTHIKKIR